METDFWLQRWQNNNIGFHLNEINPLLPRYFAELGIRPPANIFVPLCGKTMDIVWLRAQGYNVVGVEISPLAVESFFREQGLTPTCNVVDGLSLWQADGVRIWCADFFKMDASHLGQIEATYDRAALIAMPARMRQRYTQLLLSITGHAPQMLITLDYPQEQMDGPPFSVSGPEVADLYGAVYAGAATPLASADVLPSHERFAARGLTRLNENVYILQVSKK